MITTVDLVLTGARAGLTVRLNGKQFTNGVLRLRGSHEQLEPVLSYYGRTFAAFPFGSPALKEAEARDAAAKAEANGKHQADTAAQSGQADGVAGSGANGAARPPETGGAPNLNSGNNGAQGGGAGVRSSGDGHTDTGVGAGQPQQQQQDQASDLNKVREAALALDANVDDNWTPDGKPSVEAVAAALSDPAVSRRHIDAAAADWSRELAKAKQAQKA